MEGGELGVRKAHWKESTLLAASQGSREQRAPLRSLGKKAFAKPGHSVGKGQLWGPEPTSHPWHIHFTRWNEDSYYSCDVTWLLPKQRAPCLPPDSCHRSFHLLYQRAMSGARSAKTP